MQFVHSSHASSLYSTRMLLVHTTRIAVDAACALFARLEPLLDPCSLWRALLVPPLMKLVHSSHASSPRPVQSLARTTRITVGAACALFERVGPLLDPGSLAGTNFPADATACTVSKRLGPLLDPGSLADTNCPADATACAVSKHLGALLYPSPLAGMNCPADAKACVVTTRPTMFHVQQSCDS